MKKTSASRAHLFSARILIAFVLCFAGVVLAMFSFAATPLSAPTDSPRVSILEDQHAAQLSSNGTGVMAVILMRKR